MLVLELGEHIEMKDPTWLVHFLGQHVRRAIYQEDGIWKRALIIEQIAYASKIYDNFCVAYEGPPKIYATPCMGQKQAELEFISGGHKVPVPGQFQDTSRTHIGALLFLVRGSRGDMMQSVCSLACKTSSWDGACDRRMIRFLVT